MIATFISIATPIVSLVAAARITASVPAPAIAPDSNTTSYVVSGVRVIHRRTSLSNVVANVYLLGGVRGAPAASAGIENFLLQVSERGTTKYPREALRRATARTGSEIVVEARDDWSMIGARTTVAELDSTWSILSERVTRPRIDSADVEFIREQLLSAVNQRDDSPDATLEFAADSTGFAGSPYALSSVGTSGTIAAITRADLQRFPAQQFVRSRMR